MNGLRNERGLVKGLFTLAILVFLAYSGISFGKPYYRYYTLGSHTRDLLKTEIGNVEAIKKKILADAAELQIPLDGKDLEVSIVKKLVKVKARWSETVDLMGYYQKRIDFAMEEEY